MASNQTDREGWHTYEVGGRLFTLPDRYQNPVRVGHGGFGAVM